ncbi:retrovirus-related pol polyprotein from transposon TNT 1-94, partial [Tanacetum coccineum]
MLFSTYKAYNGGNVIFSSNLRGNIIGKGTISNDSLNIDNVEHVDNLGFNLLSVGQICDNKCRVTFSEHDSEITKDGKVIGRGIRKKGLYVMKLGNKPKDKICLATIDENSTLWHRRLGHANMCLIQSLASKELVRNLPKLKFDQHFCDACKIGKQAHASHKAKNMVSTTRCLELLHMDLFGPSAVRSYGGNRYTLVIVDDYSRYTWTRFLKDKTEAFDQFKIFSKKIQNQLGCTIVSIRTDHGREFDNEVQFGEFCNANGITHNFSAPRTPQSNGVVERKNRTLQEMKMLKKFGLEDSKPMKTPMSSDTKLTKDEECESVDSTKYRGMIEAPKISHLEAVKRIFRYIKGTTHLGLWYPKATDIETVVYADSNHAGDYVDRKSTRDGPYQTNLSCPDDIKNYIQEEREGPVTHIRHRAEIPVEENKILTREIVSTMKPWVEIIQENVFCLGARLIPPYVMLLTRLFKYVMSESPELFNESYVLYDHVMYPFTAQQERKTRKDYGTKRGCHSTSSSSAFDHPSSSHLNDDGDDGNDEGTS